MGIKVVNNSEYTDIDKAYVVQNGAYVPVQKIYTVKDGAYNLAWQNTIPIGVYGAVNETVTFSDGTTCTLDSTGVGTAYLKPSAVLTATGSVSGYTSEEQTVTEGEVFYARPKKSLYWCGIGTSDVLLNAESVNNTIANSCANSSYYYFDITKADAYCNKIKNTSNIEMYSRVVTDGSSGENETVSSIYRTYTLDGTQTSLKVKFKANSYTTYGKIAMIVSPSTLNQKYYHQQTITKSSFTAMTSTSDRTLTLDITGLSGTYYVTIANIVLLKNVYNTDAINDVLIEGIWIE